MWTRLRALAARLSFVLARRRLDEDMRLEIDAHLESLTERFQHQGMSRDQAYIAARRQFGNAALLRQDLRGMNGIGWLEHMVQDVRHAMRQLARTPAFAGIVVITLAVGIGSTTAIFSVVEAVLLRPLPYPESDRLVRFIERTPEQVNQIGYQQSLAGVWTGDLAALRVQASTLSQIGVYSAVLATVTTMQQIVSNGLSRPRLFAVLAGAFAIVGAFLAVSGVYGVTAYAVTQRTRELAVRLALGARPTELIAMVIRQGAAWTIVGLLLGVAGSMAMSRYLQGVLFGITPVDPATFVAVSSTFLLVVVVATLIPARRIARVDPLIALKVAVFLLVVGPAAPAFAQMPPGGGELPPIEVQQVKPNLLLVTGAHANTVVFIRSKDAVMIDTKGPKPGWGRAVAEEVKRFTRLPITAIINSSASGNMVGGNPDFADGKTEIIAHEYAVPDMRFMRMMFPKPTGGGLPTRTFKDRLTVGSGADRLELYYFGPTTNRSSIFIVIPAARTMVTGVAYVGKSLPPLTRPAGGSGVEFANTLTKALPLTRDIDTIIRAATVSPRRRISWCTGTSCATSWSTRVRQRRLGRRPRPRQGHGRSRRAMLDTRPIPPWSLAASRPSIVSCDSAMKPNHAKPVQFRGMEGSLRSSPKPAFLGCFPDQPVAEIVQCGEPIKSTI